MFVFFPEWGRKAKFSPETCIIPFQVLGPGPAHPPELSLLLRFPLCFPPFRGHVLGEGTKPLTLEGGRTGPSRPWSGGSQDAGCMGPCPGWFGCRLQGSSASCQGPFCVPGVDSSADTAPEVSGPSPAPPASCSPGPGSRGSNSARPLCLYKGLAVPKLTGFFQPHKRWPCPAQCFLGSRGQRGSGSSTGQQGWGGPGLPCSGTGRAHKGTRGLGGVLHPADC